MNIKTLSLCADTYPGNNPPGGDCTRRMYFVLDFNLQETKLFHPKKIKFRRLVCSQETEFFVKKKLYSCVVNLFREFLTISNISCFDNPLIFWRVKHLSFYFDRLSN